MSHNRMRGILSSLTFPGMIVAASGMIVAAPFVIQQITLTTLCENFQPEISGDGKRVVFLSDCEIIPGSNTDMNYEIFFYNTEEKRFLQITDTTGRAVNNQPTTNEDGSLVAFRSSADLLRGQNADKNPEIFFYDAKTKTMTQITRTTPPAINSGPSLSSDGDTVVFLSSADLIPGENRAGQTEVFLFDRKTSRFTQITHTPSPTTPLSPSSKSPLPPFHKGGKGGFVTTGASISRDGMKVIISSTADLVQGQNPDSGHQFFFYDVATKTTTQLTHAKGKVGPGHQHGRPAVSENASRIAFLSTADLTHEGHGEDHQGIFLLDAPTGDLTLVAQAPNCQLHAPSINGDGTRIAFSSTCDLAGENRDPGGANMEIFLYDAVTKALTQLTHTIREFNHTPSMDRSGTRIAFGSDRDIHRGSNLDENSEIFLAILP